VLRTKSFGAAIGCRPGPTSLSKQAVPGASGQGTKWGCRFGVPCHSSWIHRVGVAFGD